jgi:hypothetical protein
MATCPAHGKKRPKGVHRLVQLIKESGYQGLFVHEWKIKTCRIGKPASLDMDLLLPDLCAFEVHGDDHLTYPASSERGSADQRKLDHAEAHGIPLFVMWTRDIKTWPDFIANVMKQL